MDFDPGMLNPPDGRYPAACPPFIIAQAVGKHSASSGRMSKRKAEEELGVASQEDDFDSDEEEDEEDAFGDHVGEENSSESDSLDADEDFEGWMPPDPCMRADPMPPPASAPPAKIVQSIFGLEEIVRCTRCKKLMPNMDDTQWAARLSRAERDEYRAGLDGSDEDAESSSDEDEPGDRDRPRVELGSVTLLDEAGGKFKVVASGSRHQGASFVADRITAHTTEMGLYIRWDGATQFHLPLLPADKLRRIQSVCLAGGELRVNFESGIDRAVLEGVTDYGSDLYAACRTAIHMKLKLGGNVTDAEAKEALSSLNIPSEA